MATNKKLEEIRKSLHREISMRKIEQEKIKITVGMGDSGVNAGARDILKEVSKVADKCVIENLVIVLNDFYDQNNWAPVMWVERTGKPITIHTNVAVSQVEEILKSDLGHDNFK